MRQRKKPIQPSSLRTPDMLTGLTAREVRERTEAEAAKLDAALIERYRAIKQHCTPPMAKLINGQCSGCFMSLPSATLLKLKDGNELILCDNCGRIIYAAE